jgi:transposase
LRPALQHDPLSNRRLDKLDSGQQAVVRSARRSVSSRYGKELLRRRGMHIERGFAHTLDSGGIRRATLRGLENLDKRYKIAATTYNLSQLMRHLFGTGTPKQAAASVLRGLIELILACLGQLSSIFVLPPLIAPTFPGPSAAFIQPLFQITAD